MAEREGHEVNVIDCQAEHLTPDSFRTRISEVKPDLIGITATTLLYNSAKEIITIAKQVHPKAVTMMGGSHVSFWDENALNECPALDVIVRREGEMTFVELLSKLKNGSSFEGVLGCTFRSKDGKFIRKTTAFS
jgi:anaerobic magnesium-protoporphyrin IX monomethyl ester cyclase